MGKRYRVRVNRKGTYTIGRGQSSSQNAKLTKFRDVAKAQRLAQLEPMVAVDDRIENEVSKDPVSTEDDDESMGDEVQSTFSTANTIFDILEDTDDEAVEGERKRSKKSRDNVSVFLNEEEDEIIDLLDHDAIIQKLSMKETPQVSEKKVKTPKKDNPFKMAKDGRIVIVNIDKKRKRYNSEIFEDNDDVRKNREVVKEQQEDNFSVVSSTYKPGGRGIHRPTAHSQAMSIVSNATGASGKKFKRSDEKKKSDKFEPYAYVPLRNKERKNDLKSILKKKNAKGTKGKKSKKSTT